MYLYSTVQLPDISVQYCPTTCAVADIILVPPLAPATATTRPWLNNNQQVLQNQESGIFEWAE